jgi:hypothetical protein
MFLSTISQVFKTSINCLKQLFIPNFVTYHIKLTKHENNRYSRNHPLAQWG